MGPSWGTSWMRSRALMWSRVSIEGDRPPCRQKIWPSTRAVWSRNCYLVSSVSLSRGTSFLMCFFSPSVSIKRKFLPMGNNQTGRWSISTHSSCHICADTRHRTRRPARQFSEIEWRTDYCTWVIWRDSWFPLRIVTRSLKRTLRQTNRLTVSTE